MALQQTTPNLPYLVQSPISFPRLSKNSLWLMQRACDVNYEAKLELSLRRCTRVNGRVIETEDSDDEDEEEVNKEKDKNDPFLMGEEERREWRRTIREMMKKSPEAVDEVKDPEERSKKVQQLLSDYPLVVEEDDPDWPEDNGSEGWGFNFDQFFDKITIKNKPKKDDEDDDKYESDNEIVWQDDNYIRPIKDLVTRDWDETVFKNISPLIILVHHRYKRPKENEKFRDHLEKAVNIIWNCRLPSPRCVAVDAVVETDLVSALQVSVYPELIFTKAGKILYREKAIRTPDELSKIMAFFYYGAHKPACLKLTEEYQELIPSGSEVNNASGLDGHFIVDSEMKLQGLKRGVENLARSLQTVSSLLHDKSYLTDSINRSETTMDAKDLIPINPQTPEGVIRFELKAETLLTSLLREKLCSTELEVEQMGAELATTVRGADILHCEVQNAMDNLASVSHKLKDLEIQMVKKDDSCDRLQSDLQDSNKELAAINGVLPKILDERDVLWNEVKQYRESNMLMNSHIKELKMKIESLEEEILLKEGQITVLKDTFGSKQFDSFRDFQI